MSTVNCSVAVVLEWKYVTQLHLPRSKQKEEEWMSKFHLRMKIFMVMLGLTPSDLNVLGMCFTTELHTQLLFLKL